MAYRCRAAVLHHVGDRLHTEEITLQEPRAGEVLVRTASAGICGTDLHFTAGRFPYPLPTVLGHEASGVVEAIGDHVHDVAPGDRVIVCDQTFCGRCAACLSGTMVYCTDPTAKARQRRRLSLADQPIRQYLGVSAFAELMLIDEHALIPMPPELSFDTAALLSCCLTTGLATMFNIAKPLVGSPVAVFGCGGVGLGAIQAARIAGATQVIAVDLEQHRLTAATTLGATDTINATHTSPVDSVLATSEGGVDRSIEAVGSPDTATQAFSVLRPGGEATILGMMPPSTDIRIPGRLLRHGRSLGGTIMGAVRTRADIPRYADLAIRGILRTNELITARYSLDDINDALTDAQARKGIRTMIHF